MDVILAHDRTGEVLHPDAGQRVATDLVVLVRALRIVGDVQADVLAVADVAVPDQRIGVDAADADRRADCAGSDEKMRKRLTHI